MTIDIDFGSEERRRAAKELTTLLESKQDFSFLRLGDGEVQSLLAYHEGRNPPRYRYEPNAVASVEAPFSVSGIPSVHVDRLYQAYNNCTYLDYYDAVPINRDCIPRLKLSRPSHALRNSGPSTSLIFYEWTQYELGPYLTRHKCLIASAESSLLAALCQRNSFLDIAGRIIPAFHLPCFHQIRNDGRNYADNLDLIKEDIKAEIVANQCDTLFLSLGSAAKIICYELSVELGIRCFDFGSMPRGLTYSGAPGYHSHRNYHNPFFYRVPIELYMQALAESRQFTDEELISRAQSQLLLELYDMKPGTSVQSAGVGQGALSGSRDRIEAFWRAYRWYYDFYHQRSRSNSACRTLHREFVWWRRKQGLGIDGKCVRSLLALRSSMRSIVERGLSVGASSK